MLGATGVGKAMVVERIIGDDGSSAHGSDIQARASLGAMKRSETVLRFALRPPNRLPQIRR